MDVSVDFFTKDPAVTACLDKLTARFGKHGENLAVSDVLDDEGHQYVHLVQKGGGVLGVALIGYTYVLEQMNIRFIRLAGTSAGAINTALMTVIGGGMAEVTDEFGTIARQVTGDKKKAKSEQILKAICQFNFFDLVDGHPMAKRIIKQAVTMKDFQPRLAASVKILLLILCSLLVINFLALGLQHQWPWVAAIAKISFMLTGLMILGLVISISYLVYLLRRLKDSGFGINPGDFFYDWIKMQMEANDVFTVADLISKASTPVSGLKLRVANPEETHGLEGDVTFIASELVTQNKIEFPKMWNLFRNEMNQLHPAGFVRASMSIPLFFESYFITDIPCRDEKIKSAWDALGEGDPPSTARFVDGGVLSNFPINLFYNPNVDKPRLPSFGIDLDDDADPDLYFAGIKPTEQKKRVIDEGMNANKWSLGGYLYRLFNTVRFYYDKDFLIKNGFFKKGIGTIPLKGYGWLNFFMDNDTKRKMFVLGARSATKFLEEFDWTSYKVDRNEMQSKLKHY